MPTAAKCLGLKFWHFSEREKRSRKLADCSGMIIIVFSITLLSVEVLMDSIELSLGSSRVDIIIILLSSVRAQSQCYTVAADQILAPSSRLCLFPGLQLKLAFLFSAKNGLSWSMSKIIISTTKNPSSCLATSRQRICMRKKAVWLYSTLCIGFKYRLTAARVFVNVAEHFMRMSAPLKNATSSFFGSFSIGVNETFWNILKFPVSSCDFFFRGNTGRLKFPTKSEQCSC